MSTSPLGSPVPPPRKDPGQGIGAASVAGGLSGLISARTMLFLLFVLVSVFLFMEPLRMLLDYSQRTGNHEYDKYSHTLLIPFISLALVILDRKRIFALVQYSLGAGAFLLLVGFAMNRIGVWRLPQVGLENSLSMRLLGLVVFWTGGFILCYGVKAYRAGAFPLLFLLLAVPIPGALLDRVLWCVQIGSTEVCSWIFALLGVPVLREGFKFALPTMSIEVAKECSGIHSTLALFIVSLLAGHLFLTSVWKKVVPILLVLPIVCISNGLRIAGLTLLSAYVNPGFLYGNLHREGGMGFFLIALLLLYVAVHFLRRGQGARRPAANVT